MPLSLILALLLAALPARAQWMAVPLPPQVVSPPQVALFGFAEAFGGSLFVSTGFGIPQTSTSPVYDHVFRSPDVGATSARVGGLRPSGFVYTDGRRLMVGFGESNTRLGETSDDGGATWTTFGVQPLTPGQHVLGVARTPQGVTLAGSFRSADGGETFATAPAYVGHVAACGSVIAVYGDDLASEANAEAVVASLTTRMATVPFTCDLHVQETDRSSAGTVSVFGPANSAPECQSHTAGIHAFAVPSFTGDDTWNVAFRIRKTQ